MGIHDRDYYRESTRGWWDGWSHHPATVWIIGICCGVFFLQLFTRGQLTEWGMFHLPSILDGQVWRVLTAHFLHGSLWHLALNMYLLYLAGCEVETIYGSREFVCFCVLTALLISAGKVVLAVAGVTDPRIPSLGASGPVTALFVLFALHYPYRPIALFLVISVPAWVAAVVTVGIDALGVLGVGATGIGYTAHLLGAVFAAAYYRFHLRVSGWIPRLSGARPGRRVAAPRLYTSEAEGESAPLPTRSGPATVTAVQASVKVDEQLEAKLDQVLEKVARFGRDSLTLEEHEILKQASEVYKRRRGS